MAYYWLLVDVRERVIIATAKEEFKSSEEAMRSGKRFKYSEENQQLLSSFEPRLLICEMPRPPEAAAGTFRWYLINMCHFKSHRHVVAVSSDTYSTYDRCFRSAKRHYYDNFFSTTVADCCSSLQVYVEKIDMYPPVLSSSDCCCCCSVI